MSATMPTFDNQLQIHSKMSETILTSHRAAGSRETTEHPRRQNHVPVRAQSRERLPDIDEEQRQLHNFPSADILRPRRPKLAAKGVGDEERSHTITCPGYAVVLVQRVYGVGIDCRVLLQSASITRKMK